MNPRKLAYAMGTCFIASAVFSAGALIAAIAVDANSNSQWCDLLVPLDERNKKISPLNVEAKQFAVSIHRLRDNFEC